MNWIGLSKSLHKLYWIEADALGVDFFKELKNSTEMLSLGITKLKREDKKNLCDTIQNMKQFEMIEYEMIYGVWDDWFGILVNSPSICPTCLLGGAAEKGFRMDHKASKSNQSCNSLVEVETRSTEGLSKSAQSFGTFSQLWFILLWKTALWGRNFTKIQRCSDSYVWVDYVC